SAAVELMLVAAASCFCFSSRRRHTRSTRDWSSDVCSSDLPRRKRGPVSKRIRASRARGGSAPGTEDDAETVSLVDAVDDLPPDRSEERRVGKEWSCRRQLDS